MSPIAYTIEPSFRDEFLDLARLVTDRQMIARHYLHMGERQRRVYFGDDRAVAQKKIFYALRPAAALRWLRHHPDEVIAPMHFPMLLQSCDAPADVVRIVTDLMARKAMTRELGSEPLPAPILAFIDREFEHARAVFAGARQSISPESLQRAEALFRKMVRKYRPN
jgi:predicted nucleotidyltransferase